MTAQEAAQLFVEGKQEECREWCCCRHPDSKPFAMMVRGESAATRTAAVALELDAKDNRRAIGAGLARSFLRTMAGESAP